MDEILAGHYGFTDHKQQRLWLRRVWAYNKSIIMKILVTVLLVLLALAQYQLWIGEGSLSEIHHLKQAIELQKQENSLKLARNMALEAEVNDLKEGLAAIEERARSELGMIMENETFYHVIEPEKAAAPMVVTHGKTPMNAVALGADR